MTPGGARYSVLLYLPCETNRIEKMVDVVVEAMDGRSYEIVLLDDGAGGGRSWREALRTKCPRIKVVRFSKTFGESAAVDAALPHAEGEVIMTLPSRIPFSAEEVRSLIDGVEGGADLVIGFRSGDPERGVERFPIRMYRYLTRRATGVSFRDLNSGVRAFRREVAEEISIYGEMIRFLPVLAVGRGYRVEQIPLTGSWPKSKGRGGLPKPTVYLNRMIDVLTLYFLLRFTKKPLRFFGLVGAFLLLPGVLINLYLFVDRIVFSHGIAGRPLLLLGILLLVLGVQTISIGLIGEMIIFTHSRETRDYSILEVLEE
ncbi:MAG: glycosyltransferase [Candidatus Eisenbacteria bacterium]